MAIIYRPPKFSLKKTIILIIEIIISFVMCYLLFGMDDS
jgi:hypothetical protein